MKASGFYGEEISFIKRNHAFLQKICSKEYGSLCAAGMDNQVLIVITHGCCILSLIKLLDPRVPDDALDGKIVTGSISILNKNHSRWKFEKIVTSHLKSPESTNNFTFRKSYWNFLDL